jgi:hypothetical protein
MIRTFSRRLGPKLGVYAVAAVLTVACGGQPDDTDGSDVVEVLPGYDEVGKADSTEGGGVELKFTLPSWQIARARDKFKLRDSSAARREITFYDTPWLELYDGGVVLRARKQIDAADDSTIKLRPIDPELVDGSWFSLSGFKCEEDRSATKSVMSCSLTVKQDRGEIDEVADGVRSIDKLFSSDQEELLSTYAYTPAWDELAVLGPADARVWKVKVSSFGSTLTFELWELPDNSQILELSTRVSAESADQKQAQLAAYLQSKGFDTSTEQETKTQAALDYFSSEYR